MERERAGEREREMEREGGRGELFILVPHSMDENAGGKHQFFGESSACDNEASLVVPPERGWILSACTLRMCVVETATQLWRWWHKMTSTSDLADLLCTCTPKGPLQVAARVEMLCITWWRGSTRSDLGPVPGTNANHGSSATVTLCPDQVKKNWSPRVVAKRLLKDIHSEGVMNSTIVAEAETG